jgi:hypothetical protein
VIVGDPAVFALESTIVRAYERPSLRALGCFLIHCCGQSFGVRSAEASMLACSFDAVKKRLADRGTHTAPFAEADAGSIADSVLRVLFAEQPPRQRFLGLSTEQFSELLYSANLIWAPDGDQAFDDGSYILHFDVGNRIRVVGFKASDNSTALPVNVTDIFMTADEFYSILDQWQRAFYSEWKASPKIVDKD